MCNYNINTTCWVALAHAIEFTNDYPKYAAQILVDTYKDVFIIMNIIKHTHGM